MNWKEYPVKNEIEVASTVTPLLKNYVLEMEWFKIGHEAKSLMGYPLSFLSGRAPLKQTDKRTAKIGRASLEKEVLMYVKYTLVL